MPRWIKNSLHNPIQLGWSDWGPSDPHGGISFPQDNWKSLEQVSGGFSRGGSISLTQKSAKVLDGVNCPITPTTNGLHYKGDKGDSNCTTCRCMCSHLPVLTNREGMTLGHGCTCKSLLLESRDDSDSHSSRLSAFPEWKIDISRPTTRTRNQWWYFLSRCQSCRLGSGKQSVPKRIMSVDTVSISTTTNTMVPNASIAAWHIGHCKPSKSRQSACARMRTKRKLFRAHVRVYWNGRVRQWFLARFG